MTAAQHPRAIVWVRRDLRLDDHVAAYAAAQASAGVVFAFVLDPLLLRGPRVGAPIVQFFFDALRALREQLRAAGSELVLLEGEPERELLALARHIGATALFFNVDYEPSAVARDAAVSRDLRAGGVAVYQSTDHVYYGAADVLKDDGTPYTVFTPYKRRWHARREADPRPPVPSERALAGRLLPRDELGPARDVPAPEAYGHTSNAGFPRGGCDLAEALLSGFLAGPVAGYAVDRNLPACEGTSRLSPHLRAGTLGIRAAVERAARLQTVEPHAAAGARAWIDELVWRDFYQQLLAHRPALEREPFLDAARSIAYRDDPAGFTAWCEARTGYPIVDAAMVQLNTTGWMHNRLRMIVASFLSKHLLCDYRLGERYFETRLADADLAANNGGWQWSASTGVDAAPYFRVFNPTLQAEKFDPHGTFVRAMLPALAKVPDAFVHEPSAMPPLLQAEYGCVIGQDYPAPIVEHAWARRRAISVFGEALGKRNRLSSP